MMIGVSGSVIEDSTTCITGGGLGGSNTSCGTGLFVDGGGGGRGGR